MRDHTKLKAYQATRSFPKDELFGLRAQMRRAAVSVASNIVEGCARNTRADYLHFLDIAFGSLRELGYQVSLTNRLHYLKPDAFEPLHAKCIETSKVLAALIRSLRRKT